ncbi:uncharacterized protein LOC119092208 [Pollicipes pollicipes]|uniref:uncharacterized protein LOC119092208 n=1 Tax=Pollicipes pollicipes TaxID=41117 RepID=UPI001884CBB8|nr:uncharacterized protein LOC119092208 [Pollicipes pollicipes]
MLGRQQDAALSEWAEEIEQLLGCEDYAQKPSRQHKEATLAFIAKQELEKSNRNEEVPDSSHLSSKHEQQIHGTKGSRCIFFFVCLCALSFAAIKFGYCNGKSLKLCWNNNIQDWIYPVLRGIRLISLPVIQYFPSITDIHEETCLVDNPLYWDPEVDCTLCKDVGVVTLPHAEQFEDLFYHKGVPVVVQDAIAAPVSLAALTRLYALRRDDIVAGSARRLLGLDRLMAAAPAELAALPHCVQWRLLRVSAVRHLRQLFRRPYFVSKKTEVSLHRYIYLCGAEGGRFPLPVTEFANVWVSQHSGTRQIQLTPSSECSATCRTVSALLRPGDTLFYNWRYWRASSLPMHGPLPKFAAMLGRQQDAALSEWAEEIEQLLGCEDYAQKPSRQHKEATLAFIAKQELEKSNRNEEVPDSSHLSSKHEQQIHGTKGSRCIFFIVCLCALSFAVIKFGYCNGKSLKLCWNNNIQDWIYPVLRGIRLISLPVIQYFPSITDIHEETCLVDNPLYWDPEVDCTLCKDVGVVTLPHAEQFEDLFYHKGVPVVVQDAIAAPVSLAALTRLYALRRDDIVAGSARRLLGLDRLMAAAPAELAALPHCVQWRLLRVSAVRHLRQLFRRPYFVSKKTEVSLHRYIYLCGAEGGRFPLPVTEFANVWVSQHSGTRQIQLTPSSECSATCRTVSALLRPGDTLFYNWRYWRASSLPMHGPLPAAGDGQGTAWSAPAQAETERDQAVDAAARQPPTAVGQGMREADASLAGAGHVTGESDQSPTDAFEAAEEVVQPRRKGCESAEAADCAAGEPAVGITFIGSFY